MHYVFGLFVRLCARGYVRARAEAYTVTSSFHRVVAQMYQPTKKMWVCAKCVNGVDVIETEVERVSGAALAAAISTSSYELD